MNFKMQKNNIRKSVLTTRNVISLVNVILQISIQNCKKKKFRLKEETTT